MIRFYSEELLVPCLIPKLEGHLFLAVRDALCDIPIRAAVLHVGGLSSIRNLRTRHAVVARIH